MELELELEMEMELEHVEVGEDGGELIFLEGGLLDNNLWVWTVGSRFLEGMSIAAFFFLTVMDDGMIVPTRVRFRNEAGINAMVVPAFPNAPTNDTGLLF